MSKVLVTGASGFIGGHLLDALLARGHEVTALTRSTSRSQRLNELSVRQVHCDFHEPDDLTKFCEKIDYVYHVAGIIAARSKEDRQKVNVEASRALADACAAQPTPPTLLLVSSIAAAGPANDGRPLTESDPARPVSDYGRSKREAELAVASVADRVPVTIVRPPIVFGQRDEDWLAMFKFIRRWRTTFIPGWRHLRQYSFVHVADLVAALIAAAEQGRRVDGEDARTDNFRRGCYFAADDECLTFGQFGRLVSDAVGRRRMLKLGVPDSWMKVVGAVGNARTRLTGQPSNLSADKVREINAGSWICSSQLARDELGFQTEASLAERLRQTAQWLLDEGRL